MKHRVKIVAHNPPDGMRMRGQDVGVHVDGKLLEGVTSVKWEVPRRNEFVKCTIEMQGVELEWEGEGEVGNTQGWFSKFISWAFGKNR